MLSPNDTYNKLLSKSINQVGLSNDNDDNLIKTVQWNPITNKSIQFYRKKNKLP